jgi:hypothetical protein
MPACTRNPAPQNEEQTMRKLLSAACLCAALTASAQATPASDVAEIGAVFSVYQEVCKGVVPIRAWNFVLDSVKKYGSDKQAAERKILSLLQDRKQVGDGKFCMALTKSVDAMLPGLEAMASGR